MQERTAWQYYTDCFKKNYANFEGRARRSEYWYFTLFNSLIALIPYLFFVVIGATTESPVLIGIGALIFGVYILAAIVPGLAVAVRRLHDTDKSGWMYLIGFIPFIGSIVLLVFFCTEGTRGPNQYGSDPKEIDVFEKI